MHFGDRPAGERALLRLIEIEPDNVEALQFLAQERLRQARETDSPEERTPLRSQAREYLSRAYAAGNNDYRTLMLLTELRQTQPNFPNDNDMLTMGLTLDRAPQLPAVRLNYASALAEKDEKAEAIAVLRPLANNPHGGRASKYAERMIAALEAGEALPQPQEGDDEPEIIEPEPETPPPGDTPATPASRDSST